MNDLVRTCRSELLQKGRTQICLRCSYASRIRILYCSCIYAGELMIYLGKEDQVLYSGSNRCPTFFSGHCAEQLQSSYRSHIGLIPIIHFELRFVSQAASLSAVHWMMFCLGGLNNTSRPNQPPSPNLIHWPLIISPSLPLKLWFPRQCFVTPVEISCGE